jgi:Domain of unknown function (DUF4349)
MSLPAKNNPTHWIIILLIGILALSACAQAPAQQAPAFDQSKGVAPAAPPMPAESAPVAEGGASQSVTNVTTQNAERIVIKNGNLSIVVVDPQKSMEAINQMAQEMGGFVVSANIYKEQLSSGIEVPRASITIRVPAEKMDEALRRIRAQSNQDPLSENLTSQDVTSDYVDLQSRLKNLEAAEADLTKIMDEANKTEDVLSVYNQLVSIREQIEVIKGQIKYYDESAALSAISIELVADEAVQPIEIGGWQPQGVLKNAVEALIRSLQFLVNAIIWIVIYVLPVLLILFVIFVLPPLLLIRYWMGRKKKKAAQKQPPAPPASVPPA